MQGREGHQVSDDDPHLTRPAHISKRDLILGLLTATLVDAQVPGALRIAAKACDALIGDFAPDMRRWYPVIGPHHARAAIIYAGRAYKFGALSKEEYDWVCTKARMAILRFVDGESPDHDFALADFPGRLGASHMTVGSIRAAERNNDDNDPPDAA
jgi:hypothetical protein